MTCGALLSHGLVDDEHGLIFQSFGNVAFLAGDLFMRALELEAAVAIMHEH